ncbi:MAG: hypothetical protein JWM78_2994 [Verrucomicrobiaceae bacterium]|nr:hypothetical protein [Verrucomicrobiaceae bacterium]
MTFNYQQIKNWPIAAVTEHYTAADTSKFARGVGAGLAPEYVDIEQQFLTSNPTALPMMAVILGSAGALWTNDPATGIDWKKMLHAEEAVTLHKALPSSGAITAQFAVDEIYDKGADKGALMVESAHLTDASGDLLATVSVTMFLRGNGGCGGAAGEAPKPRAVPRDRTPDFVIELPTPHDEDAVYKLPDIFDVASRNNSGKKQSMLRGVCCFGLAGRAIILAAAGGDAQRLRHLGLRYTGPVFTDETLRTEIWNIAPNQFAFRVSSIERGSVVMNNGYAELN